MVLGTVAGSYPSPSVSLLLTYEPLRWAPDGGGSFEVAGFFGKALTPVCSSPCRYPP